MSKKFTLKWLGKTPFSRVIFICLFFLFSFIQADAQRRKVQNIPKYDKQRIHFGFALGFTSPDFKLTPIKDFRTMDSVYNVESEPQLGFLLGIVSNVRI